MASRAQWWRIFAGLVLFSIAFGYVEAAVVAYLRSMYAPLRAHFYPTVPPSELFPLLTFDQLSASGPEHAIRLRIELGREFATLTMLASVALIAARKTREWLAAFLVCFGTWDIAFYLSLKILLDWPASLLTWDILFLLPVPWVGPVIAPILVSLSMIGAGLTVLWREHDSKPVYIARSRWALIVLGGAMVVGAFVWDFRNTAIGGTPNAFNWILFFAGEVTGIAAFASALWSR
jgi:hypothetical protein